MDLLLAPRHVLSYVVHHSHFVLLSHFVMSHRSVSWLLFAQGFLEELQAADAARVHPLLLSRPGQIHWLRSVAFQVAELEALHAVALGSRVLWHFDE